MWKLHIANFECINYTEFWSESATRLVKGSWRSTHLQSIIIWVQRKSISRNWNFCSLWSQEEFMLGLMNATSWNWYGESNFNSATAGVETDLICKNRFRYRPPKWEILGIQLKTDVEDLLKDLFLLTQCDLVICSFTSDVRQHDLF